ncbi:LOW QUALITY PROTEIN: uncharacterized protein LOC114542711 [Dendronephthya gigantea]|uniref:LOW QUALITY PROTEIN: uncharacterized protein LOC114542711 n=1 Tax=Dendronephthya gigantea TaxID=151771 RepID=UPI00106BFDB5|nr:LOW QUALITY PROTEIN: uncharacterized protein LOC114542711 [Dendronephthya gigantea]
MASDELQEKANFTRLSRLLVDKGTEALRSTFDTIHPPVSLPGVLAANKTSLQKTRVINNSQWDLLFPPSGNPPDSKTFDVTLLTVLFRNICGFPSTGWSVMPPDTDRSMQANITRIKCYRNEVFAHVTTTRVDNSTFESLWNKIAQAIVELGVSQSDVDEIKTSSLGPEDENYVEILKQLRSIECILDHLTRALEENRRESDEDILRKLAKHNFKKIKRKVKFFLPGTREWLLKEVDEWFCNSESDSRIKLLTAGPGFGKSVFAAKICEDFEKNGKLAACHFCDFSNSNLRDPMTMLQSLASQMCESVPGFKDKLLDQLKRPHQVQNLKDAFQIYLQNPLDELEIKEPRLVVIDGLDESAADNKNEIAHLIAEYFPDLPEYIKILVTSRPEISVADLRIRGDQKTDISNVHYNNNSDLELYFEECFPSLVGREVDGSEMSDDFYEDHPYLWRNKTISLLSIFVAKCQGSFLYAYHFQSGLRARYDLEKITNNDVIEFLPQGLNSVYQGYFKRLEDELNAIKHEKFNVLKILAMLTASKGSLPLTFVAQVFGLAPDCRETKDIINKINETISCLLYVSDDMLTVFHKSVFDWLLAKGYKDHQYTVEIDYGHRSLWLLCETVFEKIVKQVHSGLELRFTTEVEYALLHGFEHLVECRMEEGIFWLTDVVIIHHLITLHYEYSIQRILVSIWKGVLENFEVIKDEFRARILWYFIEFNSIMDCYLSDTLNLSRFHLESVLAHSPKGYFNDGEKKVAESLLSSVPAQFIKLSSYEISVLPRAIWCTHTDLKITAIALSCDKTIITVGQDNGIISVLSSITLKEIWNYSTKCERSSCCTFAPDDSFILFGKLDTALNISERKEVPFFPGNEETFLSCAFSSSGKRLVTSNGSNTIKLWDIAKQRLLAELDAAFPVYWCAFTMTGLYVLGQKCKKHDPFSKPDFKYDVANSFCIPDDEDSFCAWNAITLQRSDQRVFQNAKYERSSPSRFTDLNSLNRLDLKPCLPRNVSPKKPVGVVDYAECHFMRKLTMIEAIQDNLWLYADTEKLIALETTPHTQEQSCLSQPTEVYSSSFSPDGSRLASCNSDGYINVWNVYTSQVEQRFKSNDSESSCACWWSKEFLFVFDFLGTIPRLTLYPVDINLKILFTQSQQVSLSHLVNELERRLTVVDFSQGFLTFECGKTEPVKIVDVTGVDGPAIIMLPFLEPMMKVTISQGGTFVFGCNNSSYYIWKRSAENSVLYDLIFENTYEPYYTGYCREEFSCCFSNDSKAVVVCGLYHEGFKVIDLDTLESKKMFFDCICPAPKLYCVNKDKVVIALHRFFILFFDMDSGTIIDSSFQRYLTASAAPQTKFSPKENMLSFPNQKGDMMFLRLCIPPNSLLDDIKREAVFAKLCKSGDIDCLIEDLDIEKRKCHD